MQLLPLMGGIMVSSIISGRIISKRGKYRLFPIVGTLCALGAMTLLGTLTNNTPVQQLYLYICLLGLGLGMVMQVMILAAQNSVEPRHMGVATSSATLFRSIGGSIGVAVFGAIFTQVLHTRLTALLPGRRAAAARARCRSGAPFCRRRCSRITCRPSAGRSIRCIKLPPG